MNRGRHKTKKYPKECYNLRYLNAFKQAFTSKEAKLLIERIKEYSEQYGQSYQKGLVILRAWEKCPTSDSITIGFNWASSKEGHSYWCNKIQSFINLKNRQNDRS